MNKFEEKHNRKALESEVFDNLQDTMNHDILDKIIKKLITDSENNDSENKVQNDPLNNV